jgi:general secretion pathway protein G
LKLPSANAVAVVLILVAGVLLLRQCILVNYAVTRYANKAQIQFFVTVLEKFKKENGLYPSGTNELNDLVVKPLNASTNWHRYFEKVPQDPWGHPYLYVFPGKHNTNSYDLSSAGPDGLPGTKDDIANW